MRVATWNAKAVAPRAPLNLRKQWLIDRVAPDVAVLTELDKRAATEWGDVGIVGQKVGLSRTQHFSTMIIAPGLNVVRLTEVGKRRKSRALDTWWPGTFIAVDVFRDGDYWATVAGIYGIIRDDNGGSLTGGWDSIPHLLDDVEAILESGRDRLIVAGDVNILPMDLPRDFGDLGLVNLTDHTADQRHPLPGCTGCYRDGRRCGHFWTHKNGPKDRNGVPQQIDHIFVSGKMVKEFVAIDGGVGNFPDALDVSDHAPLFADFR